MVDNTLNLVLAPQFVVNIVHEMGGDGGFTIVAGIASTGSSGGGAQVLNDLNDVNLTALAEADIIGYDANSSKFVNYALTTAKIANIDENALADGAVLVYDGASSKYVATVNLNNPNTIISGGVF